VPWLQFLVAVKVVSSVLFVRVIARCAISGAISPFTMNRLPTGSCKSFSTSSNWSLLIPKWGLRPEISPVARLIIEGRYIAIYEPTNYGAEIVVVVHGMREPTTWLD
jgi:hypothetical protein